jgi:hypothetical protein
MFTELIKKLTISAKFLARLVYVLKFSLPKTKHPAKAFI